MGSLIVSALTGDELSTLFWVVALVALLGAGYCAYIRNVVGAGLLIVVAIIAAFLAD